MAIPSQEKYNQENQDRRFLIVLNKFKDQISRGTVHIMRVTSDNAVSEFPDNFFDFVYIDGDHSYDQVRKDLRNYYTKVKPGGFFCGDDYHFEGVRQAVDEFAKEKQISFTIKDRQFITIK